ncbi:hypothetical protein H4219_000639 [Mycoemilia scoparia]|uniref:Non-structural maintenance of chromosomes element 4 n=1 Tax=Mycoemilia scoparia TaxID=417184 RepID=A0A9W8AA37_9FUNG|nr:hypothetical protein H4219_000639 [Mycoemilia scoparia]
MSQNERVAQHGIEGEEQDASTKRQIRNEYRELYGELTAKRRDALQGDPQFLVKEIQEANRIFDGVQTTYEASMDSRFLIMSAEIAAQKAQQMRVDHTAFDTDDFIGKIKNKLYGRNAEERQMAGAEPEWETIGQIAAKYTREAPQHSFLFGVLEVDPSIKQRKTTRQPRQRATQDPLSKVEEVQSEDYKKQENDTTKNVKYIHRLLERIGSINFFEFVINPRSFAQSVENIFYLSFLIRDGRVFIDDDTGQPMLETCEPPLQSDYQEGLTKKQLIIDLDVELWKEIVATYGISEPVIPHREPKEHAISDGTARPFPTQTKALRIMDGFPLLKHRYKLLEQCASNNNSKMLQKQPQSASPPSCDDSTNLEYMKFYKESAPLSRSNSASSSSSSPSTSRKNSDAVDDYQKHSEYCICNSSGVGCECTKTCSCGSQTTLA